MLGRIYNDSLPSAERDDIEALMFSWNSVFSPVSLSVSILAIKFMKI
jgi:hypothetical protein